jgi:serine beta-lactamase-like protein LACTB
MFISSSGRITIAFVCCFLLSSEAHALSATSSIQAPDTLYDPAIRLVTDLVRLEMDDKGLDALSIALVDRSGIIWSSGFGGPRRGPDSRPTSKTVYRVGSVSKVLNAFAIMQAHESGIVDIDAPVTEFLPEFGPRNPFGTPITLRHLVAHYSGLVREPPVGHYFDPTEPSVEETVASLNQTTLVFEPGTRIKYSNGAVSAAGLALQTVADHPYAHVIEEMILQPLGMASSSFDPLPNLTSRMPKGIMWWVDGQEKPAPDFHLGLIPAGTLYSTVDDLGMFAGAVLNRGMGPEDRLLSQEGIEEMLSPQLNEPSVTCWFDVGFGFNLQTCWEGTFRARHGGGIYGFSTEFALLPDDGLGVVVATNRGAAGSVVRHIAEVALRALLAVNRGEAPPEPSVSEQPYQGLLEALEGFARAPGDLSEGAPPEYGDLLGEYGWEHEGIQILETEGSLVGLVEGFSLYVLKPLEGGGFLLPRMSAYEGETITFERDSGGAIVALILGGSVRLPRRGDG